MSDQATIDHIGWIESVSENTARVRIDTQSACASCHARGACSAADMEEKYLDISTAGREYNAGEQVKVLVARRLGMKAVALGYVYPFLLLMLVLVTLTIAGVPELQSGLVALLSLVPYYLVIFLLKNRLDRNFSFTLEKI